MDVDGRNPASGYGESTTMYRGLYVSGGCLGSEPSAVGTGYLHCIG